jgi:Tfp pilus assembly ATPase PilU
MQSMDQSLEKLVMDRVVKAEDAIKSANNPELLRTKLSGAGQDIAIRRAG